MNNRQTYTRSLPSVGELKALAAGRWFDILIAAGIDADKLDGRGYACPKCGGRDRFAAFPNINGRGAVHCRHCFTKGCDPSPGDGIASLQWLLGLDFRATLGWLADWLGVANSKPTSCKPRMQRIVESACKTEYRTCGADDIDFDDLATRFFCEMSRERRESLAKSLGLHPRVLVKLRVGYSEQDQATTWPMVDNGGRCVGLRMRSNASKAKWSYRGGRAGLFVPDGFPTTMSRLFVCEGPTDTAAVLSAGCAAIGRPGCTGGVAMAANFIRRFGASDIGIVADHDEAGRKGALSLARVLLTVAETVRIITLGNPGDDARSWIARGATGFDLDQLLADAEPLTLGVNRVIRHQQRKGDTR